MKFLHIGGFLILLVIGAEVGHSKVIRKNEVKLNHLKDKCSPKIIKCDNDQCITSQYQCNGDNWDPELLYRNLILLYSAQECQTQNLTRPIYYSEFKRFKGIMTEENYGYFTRKANTTVGGSEKPYKCNKKNYCSDKFNFPDIHCTYDHKIKTVKWY